MNEKAVKNFFSYSKFITDILFEIPSSTLKEKYSGRIP